jgi:hypothetical protein
MQASAQQVARRFLAAEERFERPYELGYYLRDHPELGWRKPKKSKSRVDTYIKQFGGVWMELSWYLGSDYLGIGPVKVPRGIKPEDWDAAFERLNVTEPMRTLTLSKIERKALELSKVYKELSGPRKKRDTSGFRYWPHGTRKYEGDPLEGQAALKAWRKDAEEYILYELTEAAKRGQGYKTRVLADQVSFERELEEGYVAADRRFVGRAVRAILDKMARHGKIVQLGDGYWSVDTTGSTRLAAGYYDLKSGTPLKEVIRRWVEDGEKAYDHSMPVDYSPKDLWPHREYTWTRDNARGGFAKVKGKSVELPGPLKWDALAIDLKKRGWDPNDPLHLSIGKNGKSKVGEGNHRLAIAREAGLSKVPVFFHFGQQVERSKGHGSEFRDKPSPEAVKRVVERVRAKPPRDLSPDEHEKVDELMDLLGF